MTAGAMRRKWLAWSVPALLLAAAASAAGPTAATDAGRSGGGKQAQGTNDSRLDPVVKEVVQMLAGNVPEKVILRWLGKNDRRPASLGSDDLVALEAAGASAALLDRLLDLVGPPAAAQAPAAEPAASAPPAAEPTAPPASAPPAAPAASAPPAANEVRVRFNVEYRPYFGEDQERWNLFVYLDGRYLASVKPAAISLVTAPLSFERALAPGRHLVRLIEERHLRHPLGHGWQHEARVAPAELAFELRPGAAAAIDIGLHEVTLRQHGSPLSLTVSQGEAAPASLAPAVPPAPRWPSLCEEAETNDPPGKGHSAATRRQLEHCIRWAELWPGTPDLASRDKVRASLERLRFQPGPAVD